MATVILEHLEAAQNELSTAWFAIRRAVDFLDRLSPKLTEEAFGALTVTEEVRDRVRRALSSLEEL